MLDADSCCILHVMSAPIVQGICALLYGKSVAGHTLLVLRDEIGAFFLGVIGIGEEHAFIAFGFLFCADAARLWYVVRRKLKALLLWVAIPWASLVRQRMS